MERKEVVKLVAIIGGLLVSLLILLIIVAILIGGPQMMPGDKIAIVEIAGSIYGSQGVIDQLQRYKDDSSVKAIILRIDSPGGVVAPVQEIHREVTKIQKEIIVSMGSVAASGGYYIACAGDYIFANPGTLTGSIGVIMQFPKWKGLMDKLGVERETIKSGEYKDAGSPYRDFTPEERELFQGTIDDVHNQFVDAVFEGRQSRRLTREQIEEVADGRILSGRQALESKLVDELGDLNDAIDYAAKLTGIEGKPRVIKAREKKSLLERFTRGVFGAELDQTMRNQPALRYELRL